MQAQELIRSARKAAGLSQTEAAAQCGLSRASFDKWERGAREVPPATLAGVLLMLGASKAEALEAARAALEVESKK